MTERHTITTFNSPLEAGVRSVCILLPIYPKSYDIQRLVAFDHLVVHTGDIGGPKSLHPKLPLRSSEILVRRKLIERGLLLMVSRGLVERIINASGISYKAGEMAETFLSTLTSSYLIKLRERAIWAANKFGDLENDMLKQTMSNFFGQWIEEFQEAQRSLEIEA